MRLKYLTEKAYETLLDNVEIDRDKYSSSEEWVTSYFKDRIFFKESRIEVPAVTLYTEGDKTASDIVNVRAVYDAFENLTPQQASNEYLWTYLSLTEYWKYSLWRWGKESEQETEQNFEDEVDSQDPQATPEKPGANIKQRYLCGRSRKSLLRNAISRLWWFGYLTYKEGPASQKYELTEIMLSNADLCQSIMERNFSMNRNICYGILSAIKKINSDAASANVTKSEWRSLCKYINRYGAVTLLDVLSADEIEELSYRYILNNRSND